MSIVSSVEHELNTLESELIKAASSAATISPFTPGGSSRITSSGYALSPVTSAGHSALAINPGSTRMNTGRIFNAAQNSVP